MLVIGNKPYNNLKLDALIDSYPRNTRCNMSLPNRNNGSVTDNWALCNHLHDNIITKKTNIEGFKKIYHMYDMDEIDIFFEEKHKYMNSYNKVYHAVHTGRDKFNKYLESIGCPLKFTKIPRTGYTVMMNSLMRGDKVSIFGFSVKDERRASYYVKSGQEENPSCHSKDEELKIIKWLHRKGKVDATLCLLLDEEIPTLDCRELKPTKEVLNKLKEIYGEYKTIK